MEVATLFAAGWASGLNAYLTVLILGIAGRAGWADTPASLTRPWVLIAAGVLFAVEFVIDKVPLLDSAWDLVHWVIRPSVAASVGSAIGAAELGRPQAMLLAGGLALTGHAAKSTGRLTINLSPEPVTNIVASLAEDGIVAGLVALAIARPRLAAVIAIVAAVASVILAMVLFRLARRALRLVRSRLGGRHPEPAA